MSARFKDACVASRKTSAPLFWGSLVPDRFTTAWEALRVRHAVTRSVLLPVLVSRLTWSQHLSGRDVILFFDNEGAREALVRGAYAPWPT